METSFCEVSFFFGGTYGTISIACPLFCPERCKARGASFVSDEILRNERGRRLIEDLLDQLKEHSCIHLISTTGNEAFYKKLGFRNLKTGMAIYKNPTLSEEYLR